MSKLECDRVLVSPVKLMHGKVQRYVRDKGTVGSRLGLSFSL